MLHLNNKQNKNANQIISRQDYHLTQPYPSEEKQTNKQKLSTNLTLYEAHKNHWTNLRRAETKRKKEFNLLQGKNSTSLNSSGKGDLKHNNLKKKIMTRQRNIAQRKGQTRNTEVQINEEEIGKLPEKEFRITIIKMIKNRENKMEKMQESINKDLGELKINIQRQTTQLLTFKKL